MNRGRAWRKIRQQILSRDNNECQYCGALATTVDHVIPVSNGGTDESSNLAAACARCNYSKHDKDVETFMIERAGKSKLRSKRSVFYEAGYLTDSFPSPLSEGFKDFGVFTPPKNERNLSA